ncbi:MAG: hypothetical protein ACE366_22770 [Bradymonadia bacterium]
MASDDPIDFEAHMKRIGVTPRPDRQRRDRQPHVETSPTPASANSPSPPTAVDLQKDRDALRRDNTALRHRVKALEVQLEAAKQAAGEARAQQRIAEAKLSRLDAPKPNESTLRDLLRARGCADDDEMMLVVEGLLASRPEVLLDQSLSRPEALLTALDAEVIFTARDLPPGPRPAVVIPVSAQQRCELGPASDLTAAYEGFVDLCRRHALKRVVIIGGSPSYHAQLKALERVMAGAPRVSLIDGTRRHPERRARPHLKGADLVVIWGQTMLAHAVSEQYRGAGQRVTVVRPGLTGMLFELSLSLESRFSDQQR